MKDRTLWVAVLLSVGLINVLNMPAIRWIGDPTAWREETRSLLHRHSLAIDSRIISNFGGDNEPGQYFVQNIRNGQWYSKYGIFNGLISLPPMLVQRILIGDTDVPLAAPNLLILNLWNVVLSCALAAVLLAVAKLYTRRRLTAVLFVAITLYCTYLSIYLRAQTSEIYQTLFYACGFLFLLRFLRSVKVPDQAQSIGRLDFVSLHLMWLFVGVMVFTRVLYLLLIPLSGLWILIAVVTLPPERRAMVIRKLWPGLLLPPLIILGLCGLLNFIKFGSPFLSGYHQWKPQLHLPSGPVSDGLRGFLFYPRFSVFLYFPPLVFGMIWAWRLFRKYPLEMAAAWGGFIVFLLVLSKIPTWAGEWTYGPRYILFALPVVSLPLVRLLDDLLNLTQRKAWAGASSFIPIVAVLLYSAYLQYRVNQLDFFAFYYIRPPDYDAVIADYFDGRPVGMTIDDIQRHRDDLDAMPWFAELKKFGSPNEVEQYREKILNVLDRRNNYWVGR